jgi:hypothetical protein
MGAWPDWWPANPVGSAYDEYQRKRESWNLVFYLGCGLVGLLIILYIWGKLRD